MDNTKIKSQSSQLPSFEQQQDLSPVEINKKITDVEQLWKNLTGQRIATWQRREEKVKSFIDLVKALTSDDGKITSKIQRILTDFEPFKETPSAVQTLINMACNYIDLPEKIQELAKPAISSDLYRLSPG
jgi:hypothetical protein